MMTIPRAPAKREATEANPGGHLRLCPRCGKFQVHRGTKVNGDKLRYTCLTCGESLTFVLRAGWWVPEQLVPSLDSWVDARIEQAKQEILNPPPPSAEPQSRLRMLINRKRASGGKEAEDAVSAKSERPEGPGVASSESAPQVQSKPQPDISGVKTFEQALSLANGDFDLAVKYLTGGRKK